MGVRQLLHTGATMKPDHEAAKKWAGSLGPENTFGVCGPDMLNLARAYLDLLSQRDEALAMLRRVANWEHSNEPMHAVMGAARTLLAKTKGRQ